MTPAQQFTAPLVSVVVPMHNAERHIRETLASLAAQSMLDFEVIVVDDASTDASSRIVDEVVARDDRFVRVSGPGRGSAGAARNVGVGLARGEYLAFLDADDAFEPTMLEKMYAKAKKDAADVVLTGVRSLDDRTGRVESVPWALRVAQLPPHTPFHPGDIADQLFFITNPANWNKIFRREFIQSRGIRFQEIRRANDAYFTFVALAKAQSLSYVAEELVLYRTENVMSLQGSVHESPLEFTEALRGIADALRAAALDSTFEIAFLNLVVTMAVGAVNRAPTSASFAETYSAVRESIFPRYGVTSAPESKFLTAYTRYRAVEIIEKSMEQWLFDRVQVKDVRSSVNEVAAEGVDAAPHEDRHAHDVPDAGEGRRPDLSVIIPVYNAALWIHECLLSVLGQSDVDLEVICVNDGSTDDSLRILYEYASTDSRVRVIDRENGGLSAARNSGLEVATGRYTCLLDSDDYWKADGISELVAHADRDALDVLLFDAESFFEDGVSEASVAAYATYYQRSRAYSDVVDGVSMISALRAANEYRPSACLYLMRSDYVNGIGLRFIPGILHEDNPFTFALLLDAVRVAHEQRELYARRVRPGSIMTSDAVERSMQGYLKAYLDMNRRLSSRQLPAEHHEHVGEVVYQMFAAVRRQFVGLPASHADRLVDIDASPEAWCAYLVLRYERDLARRVKNETRGV